MADDNKTPVDQLLDLFVYAPLGLALTARDQLPALIEKGRNQVTQQTTLAKMMGQFAVKEGEKEIRRRVEQMNKPAPPAPSPAQSPAPAPAAASEAAPASAAEKAATNGKATAAAPREPAAPKPSGDHLAIPGYDTLSASQVVQRLPGLSHDELAAVRAYEESTRGRRTILTKIGQLQAESS